MVQAKDTLAIKRQKNFGFRVVTNEEDIIRQNAGTINIDGF